MPRPLCCRRVAGQPRARCFKPAGILFRESETVTLTMDEFEAIRLADLETLYQEQAADKMNVSRQTFGRIVEQARKKVAESLVYGKALIIEGGVVEMDERRFTCSDCRHEWSIPFGAGRPAECPGCQGANIHRVIQERGWRHGHHTGRGHGFCRRGEVKA